MSRTKKGAKAPGYEYWSKRPTSNQCGADPGKASKKRTHRLERIEAKKVINDELKEALTNACSPYLENESVHLGTDADCSFSISECRIDGAAMLTLSDDGGFTGFLMSYEEWPAIRQKIDEFIRTSTGTADE